MNQMIFRAFLMTISLSVFLFPSCNNNSADNSKDEFTTEENDVNIVPCTSFESPVMNEERKQLLVPPADFRNFRYGEVIPTFACDGGNITEVYGTISFNDCPEDDWYELNAVDLKNQLGAVELNLNGPRHFLMNGLKNNSGISIEKIASFGNLQMGLFARISGTLANDLYSETEVQRSTTYTFKAGNEIYKLVNPQGDEYVMQSYSKRVNPDLTIDDLASLDANLNLPSGWTFRVEVLSSDLEVVADGVAYVISDDFENAYQKI